MAKKKEIEKTVVVEVTKVVDPNAVTVELSPEQYDGYLDFMAKKADEKKLAESIPEKKKIFEMRLVYEHNINGVKYLPGMAKIPEEHLGQVALGEDRSRQAELNRNISKERIREVFMSGQSRPVLSRTLSDMNPSTPKVVGE